MLDEDGNRIPDGTGDYVFNAVPTTDWGSPETLEHWRQTWAELCNAKFAEKELPCRIDHRSYERQGVDLLPTVHEGPTVRAMEHKGITTEKGEFNRWVKGTNAAIRDIRKKIAALAEWLKEVKAELSKPKSPDLVSLLQAYFDRRNAGAYSQKARINNLKGMNTLFNYLMENGIHDLETLEDRVNTLRESSDALKETLDSQTVRMKEIRKLPDYLAAYHEMKPIYDGLQKIKFTRSKEKYKSDHAAELNSSMKLAANCPQNSRTANLTARSWMQSMPDWNRSMKKPMPSSNPSGRIPNSFGKSNPMRIPLTRIWNRCSSKITVSRNRKSDSFILSKVKEAMGSTCNHLRMLPIFYLLSVL